MPHKKVCVSHDMRQPLRMVTGHLQLRERGLKDTLDDDNRENLAFALDGARRMDAMIVSLLDYSRIGRLFKFFSRLQSRARFDGTGMGLARCAARSPNTTPAASGWNLQAKAWAVPLFSNYP